MTPGDGPLLSRFRAGGDDRSASRSGTDGEDRSASRSRDDGDDRPDPPLTEDADRPLLAASDLTVSIGEATVLDGIDLSVAAGSVLGVVGPNGAGKTTLLRALRGSLTPDRGTIRIGDADIGDRSARAIARRIASVPQDTTLSFDFSVEQVVEMGRTPHRSRFGPPDAADRAAIDRAMERTDTARFADRSIETLSGGERQRVLLARALAQETPVLALDEPTGSLDVGHAVETLELVRGLAADGVAVVAAIHDLNLAARYCDDLLLLADGQVRASGPPAAVLSEAALRDAFDARTFITDQPGSTAPLVTALPETPDRSADPREASVHVVGTGARAATAVSLLVAAGFEVTLGVVPAGDAAAERARDVGVDPVCVPPFAPVSAAAHSAAQAAAADADALVIVGELAAGNQPVGAAVAADRRVRVGTAAECEEGDVDDETTRIADLDRLVATVQSVCAADRS